MINMLLLNREPPDLESVRKSGGYIEEVFELGGVFLFEFRTIIIRIRRGWLFIGF
jgi:hypothetical protein